MATLTLTYKLKKTPSNSFFNPNKQLGDKINAEVYSNIDNDHEAFDAVA
jgi:hypothetical protein